MVVHVPQILIVHDEVLPELRVDHVAVVVAFIDKVADRTVDQYPFVFDIVGHLNVLRLDGAGDADPRRVDLRPVRVYQLAVFRQTAARDQVGDHGRHFLAVELEPAAARQIHLEPVRVVFGDHDVDVVRVDAHADLIPDRSGFRALDHDLVAAGLHGDLVVNPLEDDADDLAADLPVGRICQHDVLRTQDRRDAGALRHVIDTVKQPARKARLERPGHDAVEQVAVADEVRNERVLRLVVDILRLADLLDLAFLHDHDLVRHGQRFFLVVRDVDKGNAEFVVHRLEFELHLLAHLEVERAERLIEEQDLRLVDKRAGDGDTLLLAARKRRDRAFLKALQVHQFQDFLDLAADLFLRRLLLLEAERDVLEDVHVREQRIPLEDRVDRPFVGRQRRDVLAVQQDVPFCRHLKAGDHSERRRLPAPGGAEEGDELAALHLEVEVVDRLEAVFKDL